jgi:hypothetical protein
MACPEGIERGLELLENAGVKNFMTESFPRLFPHLMLIR